MAEALTVDDLHGEIFDVDPFSLSPRLSKLMIALP
jgi:hypothetical protein